MATQDQRQIERLIRDSDVGRFLLMVGEDPDRDDTWAKFEGRQGIITVQAESNTESTPESVANELIGKARAKISN